jgi:hypothetical protein
MADEDDALDADRPLVDELCEESGEGLAVVGDVTAGVVADVDGREPELFAQL